MADVPEPPDETPAFETRVAKPGAVLFMCGMNSIRSPMAEVIAKRLLPPDIYVQSAGVRAGDPDAFVDGVLQEIGLALPRHQPRRLEELEDDFFDVIVTLSPEAHHRALELTRSQPVEVVYWPMPDPTVETGTRDQRLEAYRSLRDALWERIEARFVRPSVHGPQMV
ncbi:protein-tyrosine-phosphatase [Neorhizobium galegae]|uniref:arsenate-mycothiol transferase ArsC n=1 Tax=Neorhizobium galegae TaxID=399 RepID=UPI001AE3D9FB|nr:low molecular weight phosphatase family protein [Neorhizobium galegae]MBP2548107.1 protein-tyrosine-phosphatase [Neorhizobium galegae]